MPLGDSITHGKGSSDQKGYRQLLLDRLASASTSTSTNFSVTYVGNVHSPPGFPENAHEGHPGYPIGAVTSASRPSLLRRPNVILCLAGTNDVVKNFDMAAAAPALSSLIEGLFSACPDAVVLVATLPPLLKPKRERKRVKFNEEVKTIIAGLETGGRKVGLVNLGTALEIKHINSTDGIHPVDQGYTVIANEWYNAILSAEKRGWITPPVEVDVAALEAEENAKSSALSLLHLATAGIILVMVALAVRKLVFPAMHKYNLVPQFAS